MIGPGTLCPRPPLKTYNPATPMPNSINPLTDRALYARADQAAEAILAAHRNNQSFQDLTERMDDAAAHVFEAAGAATDVSRFFATCITCDVLERAHQRERAARN